MKILHIVTYILVIIGALNWGFYGAFNFNFVMALFGTWPVVEKVIYILVGLSALWQIVTHKSDCRICGKIYTENKK